jgi:hypothetical protein
MEINRCIITVSVQPALLRFRFKLLLPPFQRARRESLRLRLSWQVSPVHTASEPENINLHVEKPSSWSRFVPRGRTDKHKEPNIRVLLFCKPA